MLFTLLLFAVFFVLSKENGQSEGQKIEKDYKNFRRVFDQQTEKHSKEHDVSPFHTIIHPEKLPGWFFSVPKASRDSICLVGISDPGMDADAGKRLALQRALQLWLLLHSPQIDNMRDNYVIERNNQVKRVHAEFSRIIAEGFVCTGSLHVIDKHTTAFDETILLVSIPATPAEQQEKNTVKSKSEVTLFTRLIGVEDREHVEETTRLSLDIHDKGNPVALCRHISRSGFFMQQTTRENNRLLSDLPTLNLRYRAVENTPDWLLNTEHPIGFSLQNGLWNALIAGILHQLADICHDGSIHFRYLGDTYNHLGQALGREITGCRAELPMPSMSVNNNELLLLFEYPAD